MSRAVISHAVLQSWILQHAACSIFLSGKLSTINYQLLVPVPCSPKNNIFVQKKLIWALLRTILIIIIITYIIRLFTRYILPALFFNYMDDKVKEFAKQQKKETAGSNRQGSGKGRLQLIIHRRTTTKTNQPRGIMWIMRR